MDPKRVLYIFCSTNFSGAEIVMERLLLTNKLVTPFILCPPGKFAERLTSKGFHVIEENDLAALNRTGAEGAGFVFSLARRFLAINFRLFRIISRYKIDIVHCNNLAAAFYVLPSLVLRKRWSRERWIWSNHDLFYPKGKRDEKLAALCVKHFHTTIAVSKAVKLKFPASLHHKIVVLYNGIDIEQLKFNEEAGNKFRAELRISNNTIVFAIVGHIIPRKGQEMLINAFRNAFSNSPDRLLLIVGRYMPDEEQYRKKITAMIDVAENIRYLSHTDNITALYSGINVLVNASLPVMSEPLGTTIYEAMAFNRIALASDTGGSPEIISDKYDGFLFQAGNEQALSAKLMEIAENYSGLNELRNNARLKTETVFNILTMCREYNLIINSSLLNT